MSKSIIQAFHPAVDLARLTPHPQNPNQGAVDAILQSLQVNGFFGAVLVQRSTARILAGNHRFLAARQQGLATLPVIWIDVDDAAALRIMLADNRTARLGHDDPDLLGALLSELAKSPTGLAGTGYADGDLDALLADLNTTAFSSAGDGASGDPRRNIGRERLIKAALYAPQVAIFEQAIAATDCLNRGEALIQICRAFLEEKTKGQQHPRSQGHAPAAGLEAPRQPGADRPRNSRRVRAALS